jgi:hypothetical protein
MIKEGSVVIFDYHGEVAIGTVSNISNGIAVLHNTYSPKGEGLIKGRLGGIRRNVNYLKTVSLN